MSPNSFDPREHPFRSDLAASYLENIIEASSYTDGILYQVAASTLPLRDTPNDRAGRLTELLFGEKFMVYDCSDGWVWGQSQTDGYVGYAELNGVSNSVLETSHEVVSLKTFVYVEPNIKSEVLRCLCMTARVTVKEHRNSFSSIEFGGWIPTGHLASLGNSKTNVVSTARKYIGIPYLWGGRSSNGLDCSALVQLSLARAGILAPRDTDQQERYVGEPFIGGISQAKAGDLLYTKGHVAILSERDTVVHANAYHMAVVEEPLEVFNSRLKRDSIEISSIKRVKAIKSNS